MLCPSFLVTQQVSIKCPVTLLETPVWRGMARRSPRGQLSAAPTTVLCWVHTGLHVVLTLHNLACSPVSLSFANHRLKLTSFLFFPVFFLHSFSLLLRSVPSAPLQPGKTQHPSLRCLSLSPDSREGSCPSRLAGYQRGHACPASPGFQIGGVASSVDLANLPPGLAGHRVRVGLSLPKTRGPF